MINIDNDFQCFLNSHPVSVTWNGNSFASVEDALEYILDVVPAKMEPYILNYLVSQKFYSNDYLAKTLVSTGNEELYSKDRTLVKILENLRQQLSNVYPSKPTLQEAILENADDELATACENLFLGTKQLMSVVDYNDYDVGFLVRRTGLPEHVVKDAIDKLRNMQSALTTLDDLLSETV